jgi:hypothetical protein
VSETLAAGVAGLAGLAAELVVATLPQAAAVTTQRMAATRYLAPYRAGRKEDFMPM